MGWSFGWHSKSELVSMLNEPFGDTRTITHCVRGNMYWAVRQKGDSKYIACAIISSENHSWGYKAMDELMHPYYYNCPLGYLDMVPEQNAEWRRKVREYFAAPKIKVGSRLIAKPDSSWLIKGGEKIENLEIISLRPLLAYANGYCRLKLNRRCLKSFILAENATPLLETA